MNVRRVVATACAALVGLCLVVAYPTSASVQDRALESVVSLSTVVQGQTIAFCAGAVVGKHKILTASHCMAGQEELPLLVNGVLTTWKIDKIDKADHVIIEVGIALEARPVKMADRPCKRGAPVFIYGHPAGIPVLIYRQGYYAGHQRMSNTDVDFYGVNAWKGDSGGPIFNQKGQVVGVVSIVYGEGGFLLMGSFPFAWED